ncbi:MAG: cytochrome c4 [Thiohalocapsa sp.]|jgi:cytochrome c553|uniref:c-type cytochrome n=1 Tax=Thiohalocapsa sp. TaxID=2497641 RepID=UPI0025CF8441|nr:c-type cytochrome [Thiohalocapsa sp.]MCG6940755.1 cytochrome c4 [Thiohalocapsa sp.]
MKISLISALAATALFAGGTTLAAEEIGGVGGNAEKGKEKANQICQACHGMDGNGIPGQPVWPKLAGQHPRYIYKQLMNFKNNERYNIQMTPMAMPLTEDDVKNVAVYFASLPQKPGTADADLVQKGEQIYRSGNPATGVPACSGCHGPTGVGSDLARFPRISGQYSEYIAQTLKLFRASERANDPNGMMRGVAAHMTDDEIAAVASYVEGLSR